MEETFVTVLIQKYLSADTAAVVFGVLFIISEALSFIKSVRANGVIQAIINLGKKEKEQ